MSYLNPVDLLAKPVNELDREQIAYAIRELRGWERTEQWRMGLLSSVPELTKANLHALATQCGDMPDVNKMPFKRIDAHLGPSGADRSRQFGSTTVHACGWCKYNEGSVQNCQARVDATCLIFNCTRDKEDTKTDFSFNSGCSLWLYTEDQLSQLNERLVTAKLEQIAYLERIAARIRELIEASKKTPRDPNKLAAVRFGRALVLREVQPGHAASAGKPDLLRLFTNQGESVVEVDQLEISLNPALPTGVAYLVMPDRNNEKALIMASKADQGRGVLNTMRRHWIYTMSDDGLICGCGHTKRQHVKGTCQECSCTGFDLYTDTWSMSNPKLAAAIDLAELYMNTKRMLESAEAGLCADGSLKNGSLQELFQTS